MRNSFIDRKRIRRDEMNDKIERSVSFVFHPTNNEEEYVQIIVDNENSIKGEPLVWLSGEDYTIDLPLTEAELLGQTLLLACAELRKMARAKRVRR